MKKLNKKGFTLIELLAVIVVLAIVLVITIPAVLTSLDKSKTQAFQASANSIASWFETQSGYCKLGAAGVSNNTFNSLYDGLDNECALGTKEAPITMNKTTNTDLLKAAGGSVEDYSATVYVTADGRACVKLTALTGEGTNSKFTGNAESTGC